MGDWHRTEAEAKGLGNRLQDEPCVRVEMPTPVKVRCVVEGLPTGWVCPGCGVIYSPYTAQCLQCVPSATGTGDNG